MFRKRWFSARLRFVLMVEPTGGEQYRDAVHLFRSPDRDQAFLRALEIGRAEEKSYVGRSGEKVALRFSEIVSLDQLSRWSLDGAVVYAEAVPLASGEPISFEAELHPERSTPRRTV